MEENSTLLRRVLHKAARAARSIAQLRSSLPPGTPPPATPCWHPPSLLDCTDDDDAGSPRFHTAASSGSSTPAETDVDRRAAEFIERFRRNASLELRYCSPVTPAARPPVSPDTYFKLSTVPDFVHGRYDGAAVHARPAYRGSSPRPRPGASGLSIKWPGSPYLKRRPTVQV